MEKTIPVIFSDISPEWNPGRVAMINKVGNKWFTFLRPDEIQETWYEDVIIEKELLPTYLEI